MHTKKFKKFVCLLFVILLVGFVNVSFAADPPVNNFDFTSFDNYSSTVSSANKATERAMGTAIHIIKIVGTGTAIIMITYVAIKYMMAAPTEKAEFKKSATIFIVGAVMIFATTNILTMVFDFAEKNISIT